MNAKGGSKVHYATTNLYKEIGIIMVRSVKMAEIFVETRICVCCNQAKPFTDEFFNSNHRTKCKKCKTVKVGDKPVKKFMESITDDWDFHPDYDFIYFERDTNKIFNTKTGKYIVNTRSITNMIAKNVKHIKWEIFIGKVSENKVVKTKKDHDLNSIAINDLECVFIYCEKCNTLVENPDINSRYCSKRCQLDIKNKKAGNSRKNDIKKYLSEKYSSQKFINKDKHGIDIDYDLNHLISLGTNCSYCDIVCTFGNNKHISDALTIDRKDSSIGYCKENIVVCCWFCNMMKNTTYYDDWMQFINFVKDPEITELDLSYKSYYTNPYGITIYNVYTDLKRRSPSYYPDSSSAKNVFLNLCKQQEYKDPIFYFFPIIYLEQNCLWNASVDAIDSTLPEQDKHRPDNLQIIPKIFNYGKHIHTQEDFIKEWKKRGFKTDFSKCKVLLPEGYYEDCYFHKMITK